MADDFHTRALSSFHHQLFLHSNAGGINARNKSGSNATAQEEVVEGAVAVDSYARYLVEDDTPKIDSAVKAYLSLVAARSAVQSEMDVISTSPLSSSLLGSSSPSREFAAERGVVVTTNDEEGGRQCCCTFAGDVDVNRCALVCARTLLSTINSTVLPPPLESDNSSEGDIDDDYAERVGNNADNEATRKMKLEQKFQSNATRIIWNKLAKNASSSSSSSSLSGNKLANTNASSITMKPSKVLGRHSLLVAYPYIQERFRRGITSSDAENIHQNCTTTIPSSLDDDTTDIITTASTTSMFSTSANNIPFHLPLQSLSNEILPPVLPPKGINVDKWKAFYTEFGLLLLSSSSSLSTKSSAVVIGEEGQPNDSALIWSKDEGAAELQSRRESRARRAAEALTFDSGTG